MFAIVIGSIPIFILGIAIWKFKIVDIIAGYEEEKVTDKNGLARWVGGCLMLTSSIMIALYFILEKSKLENGLKIVVIIIILLVLLSLTAIGTRRYEK